jgi:beta-mannosidase
MARLRSCSASRTDRVLDGWQCISTEPGAFASPAELADAMAWLPASVPGTYAAALRDAGIWNGKPPLELDQSDVWYRTRFNGGGEETLHFGGLATIADVWLNGACLFRSENMHLAHDVVVRTQATNDLHICFRSLAAWLQGQRGRARWRTRIATPPTLRFARATLLGRMPGWCPTVHPVGPWRPVLRSLHGPGYMLRDVTARSAVKHGNGHLMLRCAFDGDVPGDMDAVAEVGGSFGHLERIGPHEFAGTVVLPDVALWWPHTHGIPRLHQVTLRLGDVLCDIGRVGFREVALDRGDDGRGFGLRINGEPVFCRGACWTTPNLVTLPGDAQSYRPWLEAMCDAGGNMVRVGGTMVYEANDFYDVCDELGLLVWQDFMFANFDYPATEQFRASVAAEIEQFLDRTRSNPSLAVLCGGSEVLQQAAMFGVARDRIDDSLYATIIPEVTQRIRPDLPYVVNSPSGGDLSFQPNTGVAHYYGVGAYLRPFEDARRTDVRFAAECLAFANVPCARTMDELRAAATGEERWEHAVPRDPGATWDFADVRDHYLALLFKVDPLHVRYQAFERYLDLSRAVGCVAMEHVFDEWRRPGSSCRGGLVWQWQDVSPGSGWGVIDSLGRRKPAWYALQRAFRNRQLILTDEGLNGLAVHVVNETDAPLHAMLRIACFKEGAIPVREAERAIVVEPRGSLSLTTAALFSSFFDISYAYRFGPRAHDVTVATLHDAATNKLIAETCHFPDIAALQPRDTGLEVAVEHDDGCWSLRLRSRHFVKFLHIDDAAFSPRENWLHLVPGHDRRIVLVPEADSRAVPQGEVNALNMDRPVRYVGRL